MLIKTKRLIFVFLFICFISIVNIYATNSSSNSYKEPITDDMLDFSAVLYSGKVYMKWAVYNHEEEFKYYKVVRSTTNPNPIYPDDGYIKYETDVKKTSFIDNNPPVSSHIYYRVCAITADKNRYCSNVVKVDNSNSLSRQVVSNRVCIQKIQAAINPETNQCKFFSTPCDVPKGWKMVNNCFRDIENNYNKIPKNCIVYFD